MLKTSKLNMKFEALGMDRTFVEQASRLGLRTPADMMAVDLPRLKTQPEFTYMWYSEMLDLLQKLELLRKFQENQL